MGAESARSTGGAHTYPGGRVAATAVRLVRAAGGASTLGTLAHVQEAISLDGDQVGLLSKVGVCYHAYIPGVLSVYSWCILGNIVYSLGRKGI